MERFWQKVDKQADGCWVWTGARYHNGSGAFRYEKRLRMAHHVSYYLEYGEWPTVLRQTCNNVACVNPDHLTDGRTGRRSNDELKEEIRRMLDCGVPVVEIVRVLRVSETAVYREKKGST